MVSNSEVYTCSRPYGTGKVGPGRCSRSRIVRGFARSPNKPFLKLKSRHGLAHDLAGSKGGHRRSHSVRFSGGAGRYTQTRRRDLHLTERYLFQQTPERESARALAEALQESPVLYETAQSGQVG